jgi:hypothetical protein
MLTKYKINLKKMKVETLHTVDNLGLVIASNIFNINWPTIPIKPHPNLRLNEPKLEEVIILRIEKDEAFSEWIKISGECELNKTKYKFVTECYIQGNKDPLQFKLTKI